MTQPTHITTPDDAALDDLCRQLADLAPALEEPGAWPGEQLALCAQCGVFEWFLPPEAGGQGWSEADILRGYLRLSAACLTTTFVITQLTGAAKRLAASENEQLKAELLPQILSGEAFITLGISHLTTSRRHLAKPVLAARETDEGFVLEGFSPWVTGAPRSNYIVTGAQLDDGRQLLVVLPTEAPGVSTPPPAQLVGLTASQTGKVDLENVTLDRKWLIGGPMEDIMNTGQGGATGGLQTSTLAVGLADAAITFMFAEAEKREDLHPPAEALRREWEAVREELLAGARGERTCSKEELRTRANSLALRSAQAALAAAKGSGYVIGHPAGRWCREALFFLVWSCPQPVMAANLCELAGMSG